jgi:hypothetical protein
MAIDAAVQEPPSKPAATPVAAAAPPTQPDAPESPTAPTKEPKRSGSKSAKGSSKASSGGAGGSESTASSHSPSVAAHPRAARSVAQAKGWGGLTGFLIAGYFSLPTATLAEAGLRALVAGSVCYVAAWAGALFVWRRLVMIEIKGREQQLLASALAAGGQHEPAGAQVDSRTRTDPDRR